MRKCISVLTPCFNEAANVRDCYAAVRALFDGPLRDYDFEHVFCDNASTDDSTKLVHDKFPDVRIVRAGKNLGFAGGNNLGIRAAKGSYVALINNDAAA